MDDRIEQAIGRLRSLELWPELRWALAVCDEVERLNKLLDAVDEAVDMAFYICKTCSRTQLHNRTNGHVARSAKRTAG